MNTRTQLKSLLDQQAHDEPLTALAALKLAFQWCLETMAPEKLASASRAQLLKTVLTLNDTLQSGEEVIAAIFAPETLSRAKLGKIVKEALQAKRDDIASRRKELNAVKKELEKLTRQEEQAQKLAAEHQSLQQRCRELEANIERLSHFTENGVEQLRRQAENLEQRLPQYGKDVEQLETQIQEKAEQFILLSDAALQHISKKAGKALQLAEARDKELQEVTQQIQTAMERYQAIEEQLSERKNVLNLYLRADREIANALPNARQVEDVLDEVELMLQGADQAIKSAIDANAQAQKLPELGYM